MVKIGGTQSSQEASSAASEQTPADSLFRDLRILLALHLVGGLVLIGACAVRPALMQNSGIFYYLFSIVFVEGNLACDKARDAFVDYKARPQSHRQRPIRTTAATVRVWLTHLPALP